MTTGTVVADSDAVSNKSSLRRLFVLMLPINELIRQVQRMPPWVSFSQFHDC
jgi:hypothetical protein